MKNDTTIISRNFADNSVKAIIKRAPELLPIMIGARRARLDKAAAWGALSATEKEIAIICHFSKKAVKIGDNENTVVKTDHANSKRSIALKFYRSFIKQQ